MMLYGNEENNIYKAFRAVLEGEYYRYGEGSLRELLLSSDYEVIWLNIDKYMDEILSYIPKSQRKKAKRAIQLMNEQYVKISHVRTEPPAWLKEYLINKFLTRYFSMSPELILHERINDIFELVPVHAKLKDKYKEVVLIKPTQKELSKIKLEDINLERAVDDILDHTRKETGDQEDILVVKDEELVKIAVPRRVFYRSIDEKSVKREIVMKELKRRGIIGELEKRGLKIKTGDDWYTVSLRTEPKEVDMPAFDGGKAVEFYGIILKNTDYEAGHVIGKLSGKIHGTNVSIAVSTEMYDLASEYRDMLEFTSIEDIPRAIDNTRDLLIRLANGFRQVTDSVITKLGNRKDLKWELRTGYYTSYTPGAGEHSHVEVRSNTVTLRIYKKVTDNTSAEVTATIDTLHDPPLVKSVKIGVALHSKSRKIDLEDLISRIGRRIKEAEKYYTGRGYIKIEAGLNPNKYGLIDTIKKAEEIARELDKEYRKEMERVEKLKKQAKMSVEKYVALFMYRALTGAELDTLIGVGRDKIAMYALIGRLIKKLDPEFYEKIKEENDGKFSVVNNEYSIAQRLLEIGYVTLGKDGIVRVNGKKLTDLLKDIEIEPVVTNINESLAEKILFSICPFDKSYVKCLEEKNILSEKTFKLVFKYAKEYIKPEDMAVNIDGKPAWEYLSDKEKEEYIIRLTSQDLYNILSSPELRRLYSDYLDMIEETLIKHREPSLITKYLYNYRKDLLGPLSLAKPFEGYFFFGLNTGRYIVQVEAIEPDGYKFIVYDSTTRIGFRIKEETPSDLIVDLDMKYMRYYDEYMRLKEMEEDLKTLHIEIDEGNYREGFKIPHLVEDHYKIIDIKPGLSLKYQMILKGEKEEVSV